MREVIAFAGSFLQTPLAACELASGTANSEGVSMTPIGYTIFEGRSLNLRILQTRYSYIGALFAAALLVILGVAVLWSGVLDVRRSR